MAMNRRGKKGKSYRTLFVKSNSDSFQALIALHNAGIGFNVVEIVGREPQIIELPKLKTPQGDYIGLVAIQNYAFAYRVR